MEIQGRIIQVLPLQSGIGQQSQKEWKKQEYILEQGGPYPKKVCFNLWGDTIDRFQLREGEDVTVQIDIESREYNGRWYTDVRAWRVDRGLVSLQGSNPSMTQPMPSQPGAPQSWVQTQPQSQTPSSSSNNQENYSSDDLPF